LELPELLDVLLVEPEEDVLPDEPLLAVPWAEDVPACPLIPPLWEELFELLVVFDEEELEEELLDELDEELEEELEEDQSKSNVCVTDPISIVPLSVTPVTKSPCDTVVALLTTFVVLLFDWFTRNATITPIQTTRTVHPKINFILAFFLLAAALFPCVDDICFSFL